MTRGIISEKSVSPEEFEERVDPDVHHREEHFGTRAESEAQAREVAR